jgi:hypothetical protein
MHILYFNRRFLLISNLFFVLDMYKKQEIPGFL